MPEPIGDVRGLWIHNKTGEEYYVLGPGTEATNGREGVQYVIYRRAGEFSARTEVFIREAGEFAQKFTRKNTAKEQKYASQEIGKKEVKVSGKNPKPQARE